MLVRAARHDLLHFSVEFSSPRVWACRWGTPVRPENPSGPRLWVSNATVACQACARKRWNDVVRVGLRVNVEVSWVLVQTAAAAERIESERASTVSVPFSGESTHDHVLFIPFFSRTSHSNPDLSTRLVVLAGRHRRIVGGASQSGERALRPGRLSECATVGIRFSKCPCDFTVRCSFTHPARHFSRQKTSPRESMT